MSLASLLNIPQTPEEQMVWAFAHQDQHQKIVDAIFRANSQTVLPLYILDPMPSTKDPEIETWLALNQAAHNDFNAVINQGGNDLSSVNWKEPDQVNSFIRLHFNEHLQAQQALGFSD